jgi:hypothetical protein
MNIHRRRAVISRAVHGEALEAADGAETFAVGVEFRVNTFTINAQTSPAVASDADGDFAVARQINGSGDDTFTVRGGYWCQLSNRPGPPISGINGGGQVARSAC